MVARYLVVGLGNPGVTYERTRHNVGFMIIDALEQAQAVLGRDDVFLLKPQTYMNKSGEAVREVCRREKVRPEDIIVVHDDVDLPLGTLRIGFGRGSGGHRGVESIIRALGTKDFTRLRVGVVPTTIMGKLKKPKGEGKVVGHLLGMFARGEQKKLEGIVERAARAVAMIIEHGRERAMNEFNADVSLGTPTRRRRG